MTNQEANDKLASAKKAFKKAVSAFEKNPTKANEAAIATPASEYRAAYKAQFEAE